MVLRPIRGVVIASQRHPVDTRFDKRSTRPAYLRGPARRKLGFDIGPNRAINRNVMKATPQLHDLDQSLCLDNITLGPSISQTHRPCIDDLAVTFPAPAMQIGWEGESL